MKAITQDYKEAIKEFGKQLDSKITYELDGETVELGAEELNSITPTFQGGILKSVMRELDIDSNEDIPLNTVLTYQFGVKVGNSYEYINYGNFVVYKSEKQEDTRSYKLTCYDKMLYAMKDYDEVVGIYPMTVRDYISELCDTIGLTFKNASDTFANYDKLIPSDLYKGIGYTYRDVLDELAQVTASTICINEQDDELEIRYINNTQGTNLYRNSDTFEGNGSAGWIVGGTIDTINTKDGSYSIRTNSAWGGPAVNLVDLYNQGKIQVNDTLTYSVYFMTNFVPSSGNAFNFTLYRSSTSGGINFKQFAYNEIEPNTWYRLDISFEVTDYSITSNRARIELNYYDNNDRYYFGNNRENYVWFAQPQVELGNKLSNYSPNNLDLIDEELLKDVNVEFGEKYGPVNSIVLSRSAESDNVYLRDEESIAENGLCEIKIKDNQIMNFNDRSDYLQDILDRLDGLEYYINDFTSTGITYLELCDRYNVEVFGKIYSCILFNDETKVTQGLEEIIYTDMPEDSVTDYSKADKTDRRINQVYIIADKQAGQIQSLVTQNIENENQIRELQTQMTQTSESLQVSVSELTEQLNQTSQELNESIDNINSTLNDGVESLKNTLVTIDINGISVSTNTSAISTLMTNDKFAIQTSSGQTLAYFGYDYDLGKTVSRMDNLEITTYLTAGYHRQEKMDNGRTGWFYNGGA